MTVPTTNLALWLRADSNVATSGARQFYGADKGHLRIADNAALSVTTGDFTVAFWVYFDSTNTSWMLSKGGGGTVGYAVWVQTGVIKADIFASLQVIITGAAVSTATWYYVVVEYDRDGNGTIYVNDVAGTPTSIAAQSASIDDAGAFALGAFNGPSDYFSGRLSRAAKWDRLLTSAEKTWLYNSGSGRLYGELGVAATDGSALLTSLSAYWNLNENSGTDNAIDAHSTNDLTPTFAELITNGGFETAGSGGADVFAGWNEARAGAGTITDETVVVDAGSHACQLSSGAYPPDYAEVYQSVLSTGHRYQYTLRARNDGSNNATIFVGNSNPITITLTSSYETITGIATASQQSFFLDKGVGGTTGTAYFDSVSVVALDIPAAAGVGESTGVTDGDPVSRWTSKDAGAYEFAQATASKRPLYKASAINSQPGILFDGVDDLLVCSSAFLTGETGTVIIVFRLTAVPDAYQTMLASSDEASDTRYVEFRARGNTANPHIMMEQRNADTADTLDGDTTVNVDTDYAMVFHGSGSEITAMLNDTAQTITADAGANTGDWWDDSTAKDNVTIGAVKRSSETRHLSAYVADVIVYSTVQGNAELADLDDYVFSTYGLSIGDYPTEETTVSIVGWSQNYRQNGTDLVEHTFEWLSDASGNVTMPSGLAVSGQIERVVFIPSSSAAPTSLYDVTLTDEDGVDVLAGQGANLSATVKSSVKPGIPLKDGTTTSTVPTVVDGILTLNVSNAGDSKGGTVLVYVR